MTDKGITKALDSFNLNTELVPTSKVSIFNGMVPKLHLYFLFLLKQTQGQNNFVEVKPENSSNMFKSEPKPIAKGILGIKTILQRDEINK